MRYAFLFVAVIMIYSFAWAQDHAHHKQVPEKLTPEFKQFMREMDAGMKKMMDDMHAPGYSGDADVDFLAMMIPHHEGAIEMARLVLIHGKDPLVRKLAEDIIAAQKVEIETMKRRLTILQKGMDMEPEGFPALSGTRGALEKVKAADWSKLQTVIVSLTEYKFIPTQLVFKIDTPYKLILRNDGKEKHYFVSEGFFRAIALRKVQSSDGEVKAPYITAIEVYPGRSMEIYFIPDREGIYDLTCTTEGHAEKGMTGKIRIEDGKPKSPEILKPYTY